MELHPYYRYVSRKGYVIWMGFMELLCDASYNERKNTVTFSDLKAKM